MNAATAKRLTSSLRWEVALQFRNGFYYAVGFIIAFWVVIYTQLPQLDLRAILPGLLLGNMLVTTFYFMAGLVMLEKAEGSLEARVVTPLRSTEYLLVKVIALSLLVLAENLLIAGLFSGLRFALFPLALGLVLSGAIFTLVGFLAVARYDSINEFLLPSLPYTLALMLPMLDYFGILPQQMLHPLFYLHPVQAALVLMEGGFRPLSALEWFYGLGYSLAGIVLLFVLCRRAFRRFVTVH
jgi:fluoroquinolone transport system permease protein